MRVSSGVSGGQQILNGDKIDFWGVPGKLSDHELQPAGGIMPSLDGLSGMCQLHNPAHDMYRISHLKKITNCLEAVPVLTCSKDSYPLGLEAQSRHTDSFLRYAGSLFIQYIT